MSERTRRGIRILHCPTNIAGQMWEYVRGLRRLGVDATAMTFARHPFGYPDDVCLNLASEPSIWKRRLRLSRNFVQVIKRYDVIHFHFGGTLLPRYLDLPLLRTLGKRMVMNYWGSDVRIKDAAMRDNPFLDRPETLAIPDEDKITSMRRVSRFVLTAIAGDHELHGYVAPFFRRTVIVPQAVSTWEIEPYVPRSSTEVPLVVHAPSSKAIKGTEHVEAAVARLMRSQRFSFLLLHGMTNAQVREALTRADIVIDQLLLGTYGVFAAEAMARGKPVICYIRPDLVEKYPEDLPIVNANPNTVEASLERLLTDGQLRMKLGMQSRAFAERYHDSTVVAARLLELYETL